MAMLGLACQLAEPTPARACSPLRPTPPTWVMPPTGSTDVPTNSRIVLEYSFSSAITPGTEVRVLGGAAIAVAISDRLLGNAAYRTVRILTPTVALAPRTTYEVAVPAACDVGGATDAGCPSSLVVMSTFTTGDGPDTTPPQFAGVQSITTRAVEQPCDSCSNGYRAIFHSPQWTPATDVGSPAGALLYNIYAGDGTLLKQLATSASGVQTCERLMCLSIGPPIADFEAPASGYIVRAVDLAGNEEQNSRVVKVTTTCAAPGTPGTGCAVGQHAESSGAAGWVLLGLLGLALAVRPRARARRARAAD
ncbi:MAG: Ig-like domain-containing protein [Deltaproteobacteria bacterium]|nr:Ig-like domain-containing protein [Deltaproteobacteria bacterium]